MSVVVGEGGCRECEVREVRFSSREERRLRNFFVRDAGLI